jgi:hypothetical protein
MIATFANSLCTVVIALYFQARQAAREIRRHRSISTKLPTRDLVLK